MIPKISKNMQLILPTNFKKGTPKTVAPRLDEIKTKIEKTITDETQQRTQELLSKPLTREVIASYIPVKKIID